MSKSTLDILPYQLEGWSSPILLTSDKDSIINLTEINEGENILFKFAFQLRGIINVAESYNITLKIDDTEFYRFNNTLPTGNGMWYWYNYVTVDQSKLTVGTHQFTVILDDGNAISEQDETNNVYSTTLNVIEQPESFDLKFNTDNDWPSPVMVVTSPDSTEPIDKIAENQAGFTVRYAFQLDGIIHEEKNVTATLAINGCEWTNQLAADSSGRWWYYFTLDHALDPGTYEITVTLDQDNLLAETNEENNTFSTSVTVEGCTDYLLTTKWNQSDIIVGSDISENEYLPIDPVTGERCVTGCTNTAYAQVLHYFVQQGTNFTLQLNADDAYTTSSRHISIDATAENAQNNGYLSFAELNERLADYDPNSAEDIAALLFACGIHARSDYSSETTSTCISSFDENLFERIGFKSISYADNTFFDSKGISDIGWNILIRNVRDEQKPVIASLDNPSHSVVIDGYDSVTDRIHINYGWGAVSGKETTYGYPEGSGWYSRSECQTIGIRSFEYDITPDTEVPTLISISENKCIQDTVSLTADFSDDVGIWKIWYHFSNTEEWTEYSEPVLADAGSTVYFQAADKARNRSEVYSYTVSSSAEDTEPPIITIDSGSYVEGCWTNHDVTVAASATDELSGLDLAECDLGVRIFGSTDGEFLTEFKAVDLAGNTSTRIFTVRIDKTAPVIFLWGDVTTPASSVELSAAADDGSQIYFSTDQNVWHLYQNIIDVKTNATYFFKATDQAGNTGFSQISFQNIIAESGIAKSDLDGNGVSDVMFQYTGGDYQIGFWMNGKSLWQATGASQPDNWVLLGNYDMDANGKADQVMFGNVLGGAYIGYYKDGNTTSNGWVTIGYLDNPDGIEWRNVVGNLTGNAGKNSIVWQAPELNACGVWTDGTTNWVGISGSFDANWEMQGCGDFTGDGKDEILWQYNGALYTTDINSNFASLGGWGTDWEVRAIGDFSGDGKDDIVLFHSNTGSVVKFANGLAENWSSLGQLDATDWFIVGAGDYNNDQKDDLLVRQYSTGMLGYYSAGDMSQWNEMGRGVDMNWSVIA